MSWHAFNSLVCWQITLTLLYVSWVGLMIGLIVASANRVMRNSVASRRYWVNFTSLLLFAGSLPVTFAIVRGMTAEAPVPITVTEEPVPIPPVIAEQSSTVPSMNDAEIAPNFPGALSLNEETPANVSLPPSVERPPTVWERAHAIGLAAAPYVAILYAIGVALMFVRLGFGVRVNRRLRSASQPLTDANILARMVEQAKKLSLRITPVIAFCEHTAVPIVVGMLRPMILIPAAMINGLTIEQLESVLTHELAHLRRRDHLMIVIQRVLEAILFFHPVTWYLSHRLHDDRETSCDDLVLSIGGDRLQYAQSLLRVAELRLASKSRQKHIALAADGQRPSKLRLRIARLLGDSDSDSVRVSSIWLVVAILGFFAAGIWSMSTLARPTVAAAQDEPQEYFEEISDHVHAAREGVAAVKTAHVKFRTTGLVENIKKRLGPAECDQLLVKFDLVRHPEKLRSLLLAMADEAEGIAEAPWSDKELFREGKRIRLSTTYSDGIRDEYVTDGELTLDWDARNWQMDLTPMRDYWYGQETLSHFFPSENRTRKANNPVPVISRRSDVILLRDNAHMPSNETIINATNYCIEKVSRFRDGRISWEQIQLGWRQFDGEVWFPTVVAELNFENGNLSRCEFIIIDQAVFNKPLPAGIFQLGAPAGSLIIDKRAGDSAGGKINRDVFDVTSVEQIRAAAMPLDKELGADEQVGVAEAIRIYSLHDGVAMKRIGPPFPLARKYVLRMLGDRSAHRPRELSQLINWNGTKFESYHFVDGGTFSASHLARLLTSVGPAELEGDTDLLKLSIPGDFVFREGANREDLLRDLQEIVTDEVRTPVKIEFRNVERTVYRATGELKLNLPEGRSQVAMNGGPHTGDFGESISGGNANSLLLSLSAYIRTRIINEVTAPNDRFEWSERWYDLDSTKLADRFHLDPAVVLKQITEQTRITFMEEKQVVPVLFIERANGQRPVAAVPLNAVNDTEPPSIVEQINRIGDVVMRNLHRDEINYIDDAQREQLVSELKERLATRVSRPLPAEAFDKVLSAISHFFSDSHGDKFTSFYDQDTFMMYFSLLEWRIWVGMDPVELTAEESTRREHQREWFRSYCHCAG